MEHIIAIDIGTSGTKTALITRTGEVLARYYAPYETNCQHTPLEQNPEDWWEAVRQGILSVRSHITHEHFCGIILGGQMQDLILLGDRGILAPAILYSDTRSEAEIQEIEKRLGNDTLKTLTGNIQDASSVLAKLLWLQKHQPDRYMSLKTVLFGAHDYVAWKLVGSLNTDFTTASTTGLLDIAQNT